ALWIDPTDSRRVLSGSDGGFQVSYDRGQNFTILNNIPFTQFYHVNYDMQTPYMVCGGLQDNGTWCGPSNSLRGQGIRERDWFNVGGGDGFFAVPDLKEPWRVYTDLQGGAISVMDVRSGTSRSIDPYPNRIGSVGDRMATHKHRFNWNSPIALGPDGTTVYFGGEVLFKSTNHGQSWDIISPDLTTNDKSKQQDSGGPIVVDNTAAEFYCTILTIAPSMLDPNLIWVGTDDGNVQVTRDGGKSWTNVVGNIPGLAPNAWIATVDASTREPGTAYVAADHHQDNDYSAYFYKTTDYGKSWTKLSLGLPAARTGWAHVIREDPRNPSVLYAGTELGLWISFDGGAHWASFRQNMPPAPVRDLLIHPRDNDLIVATHGRGLFIMDDISPVQHIAEAIRTDAHLFDVPPATRWTVWNNDGNLGQGEWTGDNPQQGAVINYYLKGGGGRPVITITDKAGKLVRTLRNVPRTAGVNRATWDLRYDLPAAADGGRGAGPGDAGSPDSEVADRGRGRGGRGGGAPLVLPGQYTVTLSAGGQNQSKPITVGMDPRVPVSSADLQAQLDALRTLGDMNLRLTSVLNRANSLIDQLAALQERLKSNPSSQLREAESSIDKALEAITKYRDEVLTRPYPSMGYRQYPRLREEIGSLSGAVSRAPFPPTAGQALRMKELAAELGEAVNTLNTMQTTQIENINAMLKGMPAITTGIIK
ncbi:MAG TPA: hypothetical protein VF147_08105, partial [Vicinamibacterales bacterium]